MSAAPEPTYPNARPGEQPPVRPVDVLTDAGAEAFAVYFVKTLDWAYATMDTTLLREASSSECNLCEAFIVEFASRNAAGERFQGSRSQVKFSDVVSSLDANDTLANVIFDATALDVIDRTGRTLDSSPPTEGFQMNVRAKFEGQRWYVIEAKKVVVE